MPFASSRTRVLNMKYRSKLVWAVVLLLAGCAAARRPVTQPFAGVSYEHQTEKFPPQQIHVVSIDLADPHVSLHVVREPDPDGDGPWQTTLARTSELAAQNHLDVAINGDFFACKETRNVGSKKVAYFEGNWSRVIGMAMSDGQAWSAKPGRCALVVHADGHITIGKLETVPASARQIVGGSAQIVTGGKNTAKGTETAPRTAAGIDATGKKLVLLVVDGRQPGYAAGMTLPELADEMRKVGCVDAINLDGGGSSTLVFHDEQQDKYKIVNRPSDGSTLPIPLSLERPVANAFGVRIERAHPLTRPTTRPSSAAIPEGWLKGNLHCHSLWSDGDQFPELAALWYREHGYSFLGISDHNILARGEKWVTLPEIKRRKLMPHLQRYAMLFPQNLQMRPAKGKQPAAARLMPLEEFRSQLEDPGKFLLIESEEISGEFAKRPVHINAVNLDELVKPLTGRTMPETIALNLRAIAEQAVRLARPIHGQVNHPNFGWAMTAEDLAHVPEAHFVEIYNGHPAIRQLGDKTHPSVEQIWDIANSLRIRGHTEPMLGVAVDDTHDYSKNGLDASAPGRGWIVVKCDKLEPAAIIAALNAGKFYPSTGVVLKEVQYSEGSRTLHVEIQPEGDAKYVTQFMGTKISAPATTRPSAEVGAVLKTVEGLSASYTLEGDELYVRAVITSSKPAENASLENQRKQAWTQPFGWERWMGLGAR